MSALASFLIPLEVGGGPFPSTKHLRTTLLPKDEDLYGDLIAELHHDPVGRSGRPLAIAALELNGRHFVRVTALDGAIAGAVLERAGNGPVVSGGYRMARASDWGGRVIWDAADLFDQRPGSLHDSIYVRLFTPTTFRSGERDSRHLMPLPEPMRLVGSWLARFERHDPSLLHAWLPRNGSRDFVDWVRHRVWLEDGFHLIGATAPTGRGGSDRMIGTRGWLKLSVREPEGPRRQLLRALARFAFFSCTGHAAMHGLGQTLALVNEPAFEPDEVSVDRLFAMHTPIDSGTRARLDTALRERPRGDRVLDSTQAQALL